MNKQEIMHYWYYFCSLCAQLDYTKQYVDHKTVECNDQMVLVNGETYSNEFLKILLLAASEFETIGKLLSKEIDATFKESGNIIAITEMILSKYPRIVETVIATDFQTLIPLFNWNVENTPTGQKKLAGLEWWTAYTDIKHRRYDYFAKATLKHCINSLASLLVLELYLAMHVLDSVSDLSTRKCDYFHFRYGHEQYWVRCPQNLPDFHRE